MASSTRGRIGFQCQRRHSILPSSAVARDGEDLHALPLHRGLLDLGWQPRQERRRRRLAAGRRARPCRWRASGGGWSRRGAPLLQIWRYVILSPSVSLPPISTAWSLVRRRRGRQALVELAWGPEETLASSSGPVAVTSKNTTCSPWGAAQAPPRSPSSPHRPLSLVRTAIQSDGETAAQVASCPP